MSSWRDAPGPVGRVTVAMNLPCTHCATPIPVNGPLRSVSCTSCHKTSPLKRVPLELSLASEGMQRLGSPYRVRASRDDDPKCRECDASVPLGELASKVGGEGVIPCPSCSEGLPTFPAPDWLKEALPGVLQIFGAEREATEKGEGAGAVLEPPADVKPIAMACPQCGGGLMITAADERVTDCRYCNTSIYLPDELWKRLHPVKTMAVWTVTFTGSKLETPEEMAEKAKKAAVRAWQEDEQARRAAETQAQSEGRREEHDAAIEAHRKSAVRWAVFGIVFAALLAAAIITAASVFE